MHHPRAAPGPRSGWELTRGFRLRVLAPGQFALILRPDPPGPGGSVLALAPEPGEEAFVVVTAPEVCRPEHLEAALQVPLREQWSGWAVLILTDIRSGRLAPAPLRRVIPADYPALVVSVAQELPPELWRGIPFFSVEQSLHQLGRIGRRIARRVRWRRWLPW